MTALSAILDRVEIILTDASNATWTVGELTNAIEQALAEINRVCPLVIGHGAKWASATVHNSADIVTIINNLATTTPFTTHYGKIIDVLSVRYPHSETTITENQVIEWHWYNTLNAATIYIDRIVDSADPPTQNDILFFELKVEHVISGLNSFTNTSLYLWQENLLISLAAAYAAISEASNPSSMFDREFLHKWGMDLLKATREMLTREILK